MRYLFGFMCVCALGMVAWMGCSESEANLCETVENCEAQGHSCNPGDELFCRVAVGESRGVCDCGDAEGTGGAGGSGGSAGSGGSGGTGGISGPCSLEGVTCSCTGGNPDAPCNRVHLSNLDNRAGIMVVLRGPDGPDQQVCTISELIVNAAGSIELDQCLMNIGIGDEVEISPLVAASVGNAATCSVNNNAAVPGLGDELQTFASVFGQPVSVACEQGFTMQSGP